MTNYKAETKTAYLRHVGFISGRKYELGMMMYFCLLYHVSNVGAWSDHLVAAKCGIFMKFCCKSLYLKKYWMYLNEIFHVASLLKGGHCRQI